MKRAAFFYCQNFIRFALKKYTVMKKILFFALMLIYSYIGIAQECHDYFPFKAGTEWEMTNYDAKNKVLTVSEYKIESIHSNVAEIHLTSKDAKGKQLADMRLKWYCDEEKVNFEMKDMFPQMDMMDNANVEMKFSGDNLSYPKNMKTGDLLPDAESKIEMMMNGMRVMSMVVKVTDRKVEGTEQLSTPAGSFECLKLSETAEVKSIMSAKTKSVIWLSKNRGVVKTDSYNSKGKLEAFQLMTKFKS